MPGITKMHGYDLINEWVAVEIKALFEPDVACWDEYPTLSNEIEEGSFSAWPCNELTACGISGIVS